MAEQLEFFPVPNPCLGVCQADARGFCLGCLRSREERFRWSAYCDSEKRKVLKLCRQRLLRMQRRQLIQPSSSEPEQPSLF